MISFKEFLKENKIILSGFGKSEHPGIKNFINDFHKDSTEHPFDDKSRILHGSVVHLSKDGREIHVHDIKSLAPGNGSKTLSHLTGLADKHMIKINLHAKSYLKTGKSNHELVKWYKKHNFQTDEHEDNDARDGSRDMTYYPK